MIISLENLTKSYNNASVLKGIDVSIEFSRCLSLIGPSGGGKSTLLRLLSGLELPEAGRIRIDETFIGSDEKHLREYRKTIGIVFQSFNLFPHLSALENICLPLEKTHGYSRQRAKETALQQLERFQLAEHCHKRPAELSGGQNQRVAIARALSHDPQLLFFDEPTSALDPEMTAEVLDAIESLLEQGKKCVIVTHQMGFAKRVSDQTAFLCDGTILEHGSSESIFGHPTSPEAQSFLSRVLKY